MQLRPLPKHQEMTCGTCEGAWGMTKRIGSIFLLALVVRVLYNVIVAAGYTPLHDSLTYQTIALNILHEHCYCLQPHLSTVDRAPLWPVLIAIVYRLFGQHDIVVRLLLCVVGSCTCGLLYLFTKALFGKRTGLVAGITGAIYPFLFMYDGLLYSESLYIALLLALCYTLYHLQRSPRTSLMALSALLITLLSYTRPNGIAFLPMFALWLLILGWRKEITWHTVRKSVMLVTLLTLVLLAPWTLRNFKDTHTLLPIATGDGKVLLGAYNYETADPVYQDGYYAGIWIIPTEATPWIPAHFPQACPASCEVKRDTAYKAAALQWLQENSPDIPYLLSQHFINIWQVVPQEADLAINRFPDRSSSAFVVLMMETMTPLLFALGLLGLVITRRRWRELLFVYLVVLMTLAECLALYGSARFRAPIEPLIILSASGALCWLANSATVLKNRLMKRYEEQNKLSLPGDKNIQEPSEDVALEPVLATKSTRVW